MPVQDNKGVKNLAVNKFFLFKALKRVTESD